MNERIRLLAEQADKWSAEEYHQLFLANESPDRQKLFNEKFAELVVKECARALDDKLANPNGASVAYCDGSDLLEHFGVEE